MRNKFMGGVLAAGLATAAMVAVTSSAEARWGGGGFRGASFGGGGFRAAGGFGGARVGAFGGGWRGGYGGYGYRRGWGGGGALAAGAALGVLSGAALASTWGGYDGYYGYDYAPVGYGYAPVTYAYPQTAYYEEEAPAVTYAVPAYRTRRIARTVAYYPRQRYRSVNVYAGRSGFYGSGFRTAHRSEFRSAQRSNFRTVGYGGAARGHMVRSQQHRWH
jgi:hypothetical protein